MATQLETTAEDKRKHLEFIQLVITRMNVNSFLLKGWTVTLVAALFALAAKDANARYMLITFVSVPIFWLLDGYYLSLERQYRALYNDVCRITESTAINYNLDVRRYNSGGNRWLPSTFRPSLVLFHLTLLLATAAAGVILYFSAAPATAPSC